VLPYIDSTPSSGRGWGERSRRSKACSTRSRAPIEHMGAPGARRSDTCRAEADQLNGASAACWRKPASATSWPCRNPSMSTPWAASTSRSPRHPTTPGSAIPAATARKDRVSTTGPRPDCPPSTTSTAISPPTSGGSWPAAAWHARTRSPTASPTRQAAPPFPNSCARRDPMGVRDVSTTVHS